MKYSLKDHYNDYIWNIEYSSFQGTKAPTFPKLSFILELIKYYIKIIICKVKGHKWVSDDYATPDSGYIGCTCIRCGESFGQTLY